MKHFYVTGENKSLAARKVIRDKAVMVHHNLPGKAMSAHSGENIVQKVTYLVCLQLWTVP